MLSMEDNDINTLLEKKASQPLMPLLRTSRDVDYFVEQRDSSRTKQRFTSEKKIVKELSVETIKTTTEGLYNLRGGPVRRRSEPRFVDVDRRNRQVRERDPTIVNGTKQRTTHHKRSATSHHIKTSDYSSDEGKFLKGTAYPIYKKAGDWWDVFPKTDYTYSPVSPNRKEIAPGIIPMPNMSRYSIRTESFFDYTRTHSPDSSSSNVSWFGSNFSGTNARRRLAADEDSDVEEEVDVRLSERSSLSISSFFSAILTIFTAIWSFLSNITRSLAQRVRRVFHREGSVTWTSLDAADFSSDTEDVDMVQRSSQETRLSFTRAITSVFTYMYETIRRICTYMYETVRRSFTYIYETVRHVIVGSHEVPAHTVESSESSGWNRYWTACKTRVTSLFSRSSSHMDSSSDTEPSRRKYLLFFWLPLLLLAAWWFLPSDYSSSTSSVWTMVNDTSSNIRTWWMWLLLPFYSSRVSEKMVLPEQGKSVDLGLLVQKIVSNEDFQNLVLSEALKRDQERGQVLAALQLQKESLQQQLDQKSEELDKQHELHSVLAGEVQLMKQHMEELQLKLQDVRTQPVDSGQLWRGAVRRLEDRIKLLEMSLNSRPCCKVPPVVLPTLAIEEHVMKFLTGLFASDTEAENKIPGIRTWIEKLFVAKEDLEAKLANITTNMQFETNEASRRSAQAIMAMVSDQIKKEYLKQQAELQEEKRKWVGPITSFNTNCSLTVSQVQEIVNNALNTYDADKTGMVDYALESSGGSIINTRCTDTYNARTATLSFMGVPYWWPSSNPRKVIQPGVSPGECWAFRGAQGYLVIRLSGRVQISAFSLEHIPVSLAPNGRIDSAPKDFSVWGLSSETDKDPELLGRYTYRENGTSLQIFSVQRTDLPPYEIVELRIESNHGNLEYTCLYRFRVHGVLSKE